MKDIVYLVIQRRGAKRITHKKPNLAGGEAAVRLRLEIPDAVFDRITPEVVIAIREESVIVPEATVAVVGEGEKLQQT